MFMWCFLVLNTNIFVMKIVLILGHKHIHILEWHICSESTLFWRGTCYVSMAQKLGSKQLEKLMLTVFYKDFKQQMFVKNTSLIFTFSPF